MHIRLGIDLGTNNVVVAYLKNSRLMPHDWGDDGHGFLLPAVVQLQSDRVVVGRKARRAWELGEPNCHRRFKIAIGRQLTGNPTPEMLMSHLARRVKDLLLSQTTRLSEITTIEHAVITVPHGWTDVQRRATQRAVEQAGFVVSRVVSEPVAAAAYYSFISRLTHPETVLVCDMGGGTFDITLAEIVPGHRIRVIEKGTLTNEMAGHYADALLASYILTKTTGEQQTAAALLSDQSNRSLHGLMRAVELVRTRLNEAAVENLGLEQTSLSIEPETVKFEYEGRRLIYELTYEEMAATIAPVCKAAETLIGQLLAMTAEYRPQGIVLAGGMSKMLIVQEAIAQATGFSADTLRTFGQESDRAIAYGAALVAENQVQIDEVLPFSIGLIARPYDCDDQERNHILLARGLSVPCAGSSPLIFRAQGQPTRQLRLKVAFGESENPQACEVIELDVALDEPLPANSKFRFALSVDESVLIRVEALDEQGRKFTGVIEPRHVKLAGKHAPSR